MININLKCFKKNVILKFTIFTNIQHGFWFLDVYLHILPIYQHTNYLLIYYQPPIYLPTYLPTYLLPTYLSLTLHKLPIMTYLTSNRPVHYQPPTYLPCYLLINTPNLLTYLKNTYIFTIY
jgi:hypothetical protein